MKKGFTLIELLVAIGASSIVISALISIVLSNISGFKSSTKDYRDYFYSMEALMFIENQIESASSIIIDNNEIQLEFPDNVVKSIFINNENNLVLTHSEQGENKAVNNIVNNINEFNVLKKNNTLYISMRFKDGEKYERCIGISR